MTCQSRARQGRHPEAAVHPLRSIPMLRPVSVLGPAFTRHAQPNLTRIRAERELDLARTELDAARQAYAESRAALGEVDRMGRKDRHDRAITTDRYVARRKREAFGVMNRRRGRLVRAQKALLAAELAARAH